MGPDVSVVIPTFRRGKLLGGAVRSALAQDSVEIEVVVVDDSPEGSARAVVDALGDPRVRYVLHAPLSGGRPARVRAVGATHARGRVLHFLDDDDTLTEGALAALLGALDGRPDAGVAFGAISPYGEDEEVLVHERAYFARAAARARSCRTRFEVAACLLFREAILVCSACTIRRELVERVGWDAALPYCEDGDFYLRAIREHGFVYVDRPVVRYHTGAPSLINGARERQDLMRESYRRIHEKYRQAHGVLEMGVLRLLACAL